MLSDRRPDPVNLRSVLLGIIGVVFICALTPYNDYALNNTFLIGNNLPLGVVLLTFVFVVFINGPLHRFFPRRAFSAGEITVAFSMTLVACALPSSGLMRYFPSSLVMPFYHAREQNQFAWEFFQFTLPKWLFPTFEGRDIYSWMNDPVVTGYENRWLQDGPPPYRAWVTPAIAWGVFLMALYGAIICMMTIVRRQWNENERLPFPLAQIHLALIDEPKPGRWLNSVMRARSFWVAFAGIFLLHLWNGLANYQPQFFQRIPVEYNFENLLADPPLSYVDFHFKQAAVYFTVVGVTYFLTTSVAFSLWFFFILFQIVKMWKGSLTGDPIIYGQGDQHFGGILAYALAILYIGRHHWGIVVAQAFRGAKPGEPTGRYLSFRWAFWGLCLCVMVMTGWMTYAGADVLTSFTTVMLLLLLFLVISRIIAETGIVHGQLQAPLYRPWQLLDQAGFSHPITNQSYYLVTLVNAHHYDFREPLSVYASHTFKVADSTIYHNASDDTPENRRTGRRFVMALALAIVLAYVVSLGSTLWMEYRYAYTEDISESRVNAWGADSVPRWMIIESTVQYEAGYYQSPHNPAISLSMGFGITAALSLLRLRFAGWPFHPVGYLMLSTAPGGYLWFSFLIGWLAKVAILRWGGASLYVRAKSFFFGLIVGESMAAAFWLVLGFVLNAMDIAYRPLHIMPG
ncbi:MAG: hypothetical protein IT448_08295 [Phycisphaerales bacterium]|nr:hypothetical protein [Phycisphaerales bacterium]